jgi:hypothetical protein
MNTRGSPPTDRGSRRAVRGARPSHPRAVRAASSGVVGWGELGRGVARIAEAFGMRGQIVCSRPGHAAEPGRVPSMSCWQRRTSCPALSVSTPATRGLIGARELALMKPDALLINTARGALVDTSRARPSAASAGGWAAPASTCCPKSRRRRRSVARSGHSQSDRHAARRLGGARGAPALPRRDGREHRGFPARRPARTGGVTARPRAVTSDR